MPPAPYTSLARDSGGSVALVLAIEPDIRQGTILKRIVRELVGADLVLVESRDAAIAAIDRQIPDVILVTALLSPRDEDELVSHLRALDGAEQDRKSVE